MSETKYRIACIGEAMIELTHQANSGSSLNVRYAGDTLNTALYLKRLLNQEKLESTVSFVSALGKDSFSNAMLALCNDEYIDQSLIHTDDVKLPGIYAIETDDFGERSFSYWRSDSAAWHYFQSGFADQLTALEAYDIVYYSAITLALMSDDMRTDWFTWLSDFRSIPNKRVAFDSNYRPRLWLTQKQSQEEINKAYTLCDIALPSIDDEQALFNESTEQVIKRLKDYNINRMYLKRGTEGPIALSSDTELSNPSVCSHVVDSTAAGDSFNSAVLAGIVTGKTDKHTLETAHAVASSVIQFDGAIVPKNEWEKLLF